MKEITLEDTELVKICDYPEQYEVRTHDGETIGYIRAKMGFCDAYCPDAGGEQVYIADVGWELSGFCTNHERFIHLAGATMAIMRWYLQPKSGINITRSTK